MARETFSPSSADTHHGFVASGGGGGAGGGGGGGGGVLLWQFPGSGGGQFAGALCEHWDQQRLSDPNAAGKGKSSASDIATPHAGEQVSAYHAIMHTGHHTTLGGVRIVLSHSRNGIVSAADGGARAAQ